MFLAAQSARDARGETSGASSRLPRATFRPDRVQSDVRSEAATTSMTHVSSVA